MRLGEKQPAVVEGSLGQSSTDVAELVNVPEVRHSVALRSDAR